MTEEIENAISPDQENSSILLIILLYIGTDFYKVLPYQTGLEFRFGAVVEQNSAGPHFHLPEPVGRVVFVDTLLYKVLSAQI